MDTSICTVVTGMPRTATTVFIEALKQHDRVAACGELFSIAQESDRQYFHELGGFEGKCWNPGDDVSAYLDRLMFEASNRGKKLVFKLLDIHEPAAWAWAERREVNNIYLRRDNPLECLVSERYAQATSKWHVYGPKQEAAAIEAENAVGKLVISLDDVTRWLHRDEVLTARTLRWPGRSLVVEYSYLARLFSEAVGEAFTFMGVDPVDVKATQRKMAKRPLWDRIDEYPALADAAQGTFLSRCFPPSPTCNK